MKVHQKLIFNFLLLPLMTGTIASFVFINNLINLSSSGHLQQKLIKEIILSTVAFTNQTDSHISNTLLLESLKLNIDVEQSKKQFYENNDKLSQTPLLQVSAIDTRAEIIDKNTQLENSLINANKLNAILIGIILLVSICSILLITLFIDKPLFKIRRIIQKLTKGKPNSQDIDNIFYQSKTSAQSNNIESVTAFNNYIIKTIESSLIILDKSGTIFRINQATINYLNYEQSELIGKSFAIILDNSAFNDIFHISFTKHQVISNFKTSYIRKDGTKMPVCFTSSLLQDEKGEIQGVVCVAQDLSDRQKAEEEKNLLSTAIEHVVEAIEITDTEAKFIYVNPAFEKITGYQRSEAIGKTSAVLFRSGQHETAFYQEILNTLKNGQVWSGDYIGKRKDGSLYHQEVTISPVSNLAGEITHHVAVKRDITERKQAEERLAKINQCFLSFTANPVANIQKLTTLCGELLGANCALYNRLDCGVLTSVGQWQTSEDYSAVSSWVGRICNEAIAQGSNEAFIVSDLLNSKYAQSEPNILHDQLQTYIGQAVKCNGTSGVVCALYEEKYTFSHNDRKILGIIAAAIGVEEERRLTQQALHQSEERYALAELGANDGLWDWNLKTQEIYFSPRWKAMFGLGDKEMGNSTEEWFNRVHPQDIDRLQSAIKGHIEGQSSHLETEYRILHQDGKERWMLVRGIAVSDTDGAYRMAGSQTDITAKKAAEAQLIYDSCHDSLTGLANRGLFIEILENALIRAKEEQGYIFAVLFLDLNRFKFINDRFGHQMGDRLLVEVARVLQSCVRPEDTVARLGGDEFTILLDNIKDINNATQVAERVQAELALPLDIDGNEVIATASIGIALSNTGYKRSEDILRDADSTMYRAKEQGNMAGVYQVFDSATHERLMAGQQLERDLASAIARQEFVLHYQPIVSLKNFRISGFEALIRWQHPERGFISPVEFIPVAEATGLINPIGSWVLREACRQLKSWQEQFPGKQRLTMSANLSTKQFAQSDLIEQVAQILQETRLNSCSLKLEITESVLVENAAAVNAMLVQMQALGIRLSLDDFGTGYSSLSYMHSFPIDTLKIDRSFVTSVDVDLGKIEIIRTVVGLAWNLGMDTVAEGIETKKQMYQLKSLKCEYGQGYFFSRPIDANAASALISAEREYFSRTSEVEPLGFWTKN